MTRATALLLLLGLAGCHPCVERCRPQAATYADCLDDWGLEWADLGASDETTFRDACERGQGSWTDGLEGEEATIERDRCVALRDGLRTATTCEAAWQVLEDFGAP